MKIKKFLVILNLFYSFFLFAQGDVCGIVPKRFHKDFTENGLIIGSITFPSEKPKFNGYFIQISNNSVENSKIIKEIKISPEQIWKMRHNGQLDNKKTYLFVLELPVGSYAITGVRLFSNSGFAILQRNYDSGGFKIPFEVKKGEMLYVGNILYDEYAFDKSKVVSYEKNNYEKDIEKLKILKPLINWSLTVNDSEINIEYLE